MNQSDSKGQLSINTPRSEKVRKLASAQWLRLDDASATGLPFGNGRFFSSIGPKIGPVAGSERSSSGVKTGK